MYKHNVTTAVETHLNPLTNPGTLYLKFGQEGCSESVSLFMTTRWNADGSCCRFYLCREQNPAPAGFWMSF